MGKFLENLTNSASNALGGGAVGMGLSFLGDLFGKGQQEKMMEKQWELEQKKMALQYEYNQKAADYSQQLSKDMWDYTNYENQVKHMENADLNPALMYGQGGGGGTTSQGGKMEGVSMGETGAVAMGLQLKQIQAQNNLANAQAAKAFAEANKINGADTENTKADTELKEALKKTQESVQDLNNSTTSLQNAQEDKVDTEKELVKKNIKIATENLKTLVRNNEIGEETKQEQITRIKQDVELANKTILEKEAQIKLDTEQSKWIDEKINNYAYELATERIKANAAEQGAWAATTTSEANYQEALAKNAHTQALIKEIEEKIKNWGIELDQNKQRILQEWIFRGIDSAVDIAGAVQAIKGAKMVKESVSRTQKGNGEVVTRWDWSRNRPAYK